MTSRKIRFFPEWGAASPLWEDAHPEYMRLPESLGLSAALVADLRSWCRIWDKYCSPDAGWKDPDIRATWVTLGRELDRRIALEIAPDMVLQSEWEE